MAAYGCHISLFAVSPSHLFPQPHKYCQKRSHMAVFLQALEMQLLQLQEKHFLSNLFFLRCRVEDNQILPPTQNRVLVNLQIQLPLSSCLLFSYITFKTYFLIKFLARWFRAMIFSNLSHKAIQQNLRLQKQTSSSSLRWTLFNIFCCVLLLWVNYCTLNGNGNLTN